MSSEHVRIGGIEHKVCCRCRRTLPLLHFYRDPRYPDGLRVMCRQCALEESARRVHEKVLRRESVGRPLRLSVLRSWITRTSKP